ncbi:RNA polymerase factor sigma-54 [Salinibacillus xinjiangensis]|uniref:RNA polymerase factor sigma-54 n=1 Tax=Salinibacillus xinjiangensis TaxID=1229268 RepID=UPI0018917ED2|nr:RNA polymerase factor sigma-54 [Salinibacillus xinjiangensis]
MELGLFQKQKMKLVMTTELRQAISLLQYSSTELSQFLQEQAAENPLIELEEREQPIRLEESYSSIRNKSSYSRANDDSVSPLDFISNEEGGLVDYLTEQLQWLNVNDRRKAILNYLILNLDDKGYLPLSNSQIAEQLDISNEEVEEAIGLLQQLDPLGVGARNLKECLMIQAKEYYPDEPKLQEILEHYLGMLADHKWNKITTILDISLGEVKRLAECIQTLNPKPCAEFTRHSVNYLYPDVIIEKKDGDYGISMNNRYLPVVHVNQQYMNLLHEKRECSQYIKDHYQKYVWLVRSIEKRQSTILKITNYIIKRQRGFLENGFSGLRAMTLKEVADEIDMHESTVSRAVGNKVIQTPLGCFEMRRLFTSKLGNNDGGHTSSAKVKYLLKQLIDEENKEKPYSDQKLADYLQKQHGITISRRTVAKYREELNILPSSKRKLIV